MQDSRNKVVLGKMTLITRGRRSFVLVTGITASAILLSACTSMSSAEPENTQRHAKQIDIEASDLPSGFADSSIVDPEWETTPQYADGVFVGAKQHDEELEFTATDENGGVLWSVDRPLSCSGFALSTTSAGQNVVVLTDTETSYAEIQTTASAYDLHTGDPVWGPVEVNGPYQGPGLVFAQPPKDFMGKLGPRIALDPDSGEISATEEDDVQQVLGEYDGTVVLANETEVTARASESTDDLWAIEADELGTPPDELKPAISPWLEPGLAHLTGEDGDQDGGDTASIMIDLEAGEIVDDNANLPTQDSEKFEEALTTPNGAALLVRGQEHLIAIAE